MRMQQERGVLGNIRLQSRIWKSIPLLLNLQQMDRYFDTAVPSVEHRLPPELERVIFEIAAYNDRNAVPLLMQVSRRIRLWLEPILFEVVVLPPDNQECCRRPGAEFHYHTVPYLLGHQTRYVKYLLMDDGGGPRRSLISQCFNLQGLAMWSYVPSTLLSDLSSIIRSPQRKVSSRGLLRMSIPLTSLFPGGEVDFNHEIFRDVTHLDALGDLVEWKEGNNFACLKNLRYRSFPENHFRLPGIIKMCLEECQALRLILAFQLERHPADNLFNDRMPKTRRIVTQDGIVEEVPEDRVVVLSPRSYRHWARYSSVGDWVNGAIGSEDLWTWGERVIENRRRKNEVGS